MNLIQFSNSRLWKAVAIFRIHRSPETKSELYDALNFRRSTRDRFHAPISPAIIHECERQVREWGRVEDFRSVINAN